MAVPIQPQNNLPILKLADLPPVTLNDEVHTALQIAAHLRNLLQEFGTGKPVGVILPTVVELAGFYKRGELDVLDALFELKRQNFEYITNGLDFPVILKDPMTRHRKQPVQETRRTALNAWEGVWRQGHNPLWDMPGISKF